MRRVTFGSEGHLLPGVADEYTLCRFWCRRLPIMRRHVDFPNIYGGCSLGLRLVFALKDTLATSYLQLLEILHINSTYFRPRVTADDAQKHGFPRVVSS